MPKLTLSMNHLFRGHLFRWAGWMEQPNLQLTKGLNCVPHLSFDAGQCVIAL